MGFSSRRFAARPTLGGSGTVTDARLSLGPPPTFLLPPCAIFSRFSPFGSLLTGPLPRSCPALATQTKLIRLSYAGFPALPPPLHPFRLPLA